MLKRQETAFLEPILDVEPNCFRTTAMSLWQIILRLWPYRPLVLTTLALTFVGSLAAWVNPFALRYTIDTMQRLVTNGQGLAQGWHLRLWVSAIALGKEVLNP